MPANERTFEWDGQTVGLRELLFGEWDVIHTHLFLPGLLVRLRRSWDGSFRWVHTVHYDRYEGLRLGGLKRWLDHHFIYPATDGLVAVSPAVARSLPSLPQRTVIRNAVSLGRPTPERRSAPSVLPSRDDASSVDPDLSEGGPLLGTVAMLRPEKGLPELLDAFARLRRARPEARLRIAGEGPLRGALERRIGALDLEGSVELCGFVEDLETFYRSLDLYVQPSRQESFGLAALEAFRYGLPVVAAATGHLPELLGEGRFGVLVPRENDPARFVVELAEALESVLLDAERYRKRAEKGRRHWAERLDPERMVEAYGETYRDVLRPRIAMIQPIVTHPGSGGIQRQIALQSRELARRGHRVFLIQRTDPRLRTEEARRRRWEHLSILESPTWWGERPGPFRLLERVRGLLYVGGGLLRLARIRHRCDLLHAHQLFSPTLLAVFGKLLWGKPTVSKVTAAGPYGELNELRRLPFSRLRTLAIRRVDRILVLTGASAEEMRQLGLPDARIVRVPNSVELPSRPARIPKEPGGAFRILFVGRLSREKSLESLIDAARILGEKRGVRLEVDLVGGPDPDRDSSEAVQERAEELPPRISVTLHGFQEDVDPFYRRADAFVLPSRSEGLSNALLEAMAHGLPCVVSDIPQNLELVEDGRTGLVFHQGSPPDLARALGRLIRDREEGSGELSTALARGARERIREGYTVEAVVDRLEEIYERVRQIR